ncbi:DUF3231 family protein [Neobacillus sp. D3-1R]|uniref:DUF3231 family protein n=1 Tax=Neobacillus sp. D3-1R TaxID=3445778 RepID=UPI003F9FA2AE
MEDKTKIRLTAGEISPLWSQYINDTASICVMKHFLEKVEDEEVRPVIEFAINGSKKNISFLRDFFTQEKFPIPIGFTDQDVRPNAPKLFSDTYVLMYIRNVSILGMAASGLALGFATRPDVVQFFKNVLKTAVGLQDLTRELMLKQGTYIRPPFISNPDKVDFVKKQQFLAGFFGDKRPLTAIEITLLFNNIQTNAIGKTLITGFAQFAERKEVKEYLMRGKQIAQKHMDYFSDILKKEDLPAPMTWDTALSDSTEQVFSDKLMMFHVSAMIAAGIGNYGSSMSGSPRRDLAARYAMLIPEIALYAEDGANIMIKHGWMEEPPQTDDRKRLIKEKDK